MESWLTASHLASIMGCWRPGAFSSHVGSSGSTALVEHSAAPLALSTVMKCGDGLWSLTCSGGRGGGVGRRRRRSGGGLATGREGRWMASSKGSGGGCFEVVARTRSTGWRKQRRGLCRSGRRTLEAEKRSSSAVVEPHVMKLVVALIRRESPARLRGGRAFSPGCRQRRTNETLHFQEVNTGPNCSLTSTPLTRHCARSAASQPCNAASLEAAGEVAGAAGVVDRERFPGAAGAAARAAARAAAWAACSSHSARHAATLGGAWREGDGVRVRVRVVRVRVSQDRAGEG